MKRRTETVTKAAAFITCEAVTGISLAAWAVIAAVAGAGVGGYSAYQSGQTAKKTGEYNAEMQNRKAKDAAEIGADKAAQVRDRTRRIASQQAEGMAMSGVESFSGTPLALLTETAGLGELDAMRTINNAQREAWGYGAQAELDIYGGRRAAQGGKLNAGGSLLTAASNSYYGYRAATT